MMLILHSMCINVLRMLSRKLLMLLHPIRKCDWNGCGEEFPSHAALGIHIRNHRAKNCYCQWGDCDYTCDSPLILELHIYEEHSV